MVVMVHAVFPAHEKWRQEDQQFKVILSSWAIEANLRYVWAFFKNNIRKMTLRKYVSKEL